MYKLQFPRLALALGVAGLLFGALAPRVGAVTLTTASGVGADRGVNECNYNGASTNTLDGASGGADPQINARWFSASPFTNHINEVIALRFDLTGYALPACTNFQIALINHRTNVARILHYYGVINGSGGANNNGTVTNWTDDGWSESSPALKFSTLPGVHYDGVSSTKGFTNTVDLGSATMNAINEGASVTFSSAALDIFMQNHPNQIVTLLVGVDTSSTGQSRFTSKETTTTTSSVLTGAAGDFAPRLDFTVNVAPDVAGIYFDQQPADTSAGAALFPGVTVVATNAFGAPATNIPVTLSLLSGTGPLSGTLSQVTDGSGVATFSNLSLTSAGAKQLQATAGSLTATSASFTITAGSAAALSFSTQPSHVGASKPITPPVVVQLLDTYGNNVASNGVAITMALTSGTGTLSGNTNIATDVTGKSTFTNLSINLVGTKQLTANKSGLSGVVSSAFTVTNVVSAFPGAEGAGANASGGRGGDVYYVTNLNDTGAGSLRNGISGAPAGGRTIVFKVSGNIALNSTLTINKPNITVAGQTAPGDGICIQDESFNIAANNVIVRHMRTRLGTNNLSEADGMWINSGTNIIVDHVSASWSVDETLSTSTDVANLTVQNCFITESLRNSIHEKGAHGYGGIISGAATTTYTYLRNLYAHNASRNPRLGSDSQTGVLRLDFRNNVVYDWGFYAGYSGDTNETTELNYVGNYLIAGPATTFNFAFHSGGNTTTIYQSGNFIDTDKDGLVDGANTEWSMFSGPETQLASPLDVPVINTDSAGTAYQRVLAQSGAMPWRRDAYDQRIVRTVRTQNGQLVDYVSATNFSGDYATNTVVVTNTVIVTNISIITTNYPVVTNKFIGVNPWPTLGSLAAPTDTDSDGMPDYWETATGLNPNLASDRNLTNVLTGYTRLEEYLNWLADAHALCDRNGTVDVNLRTATGGATNLTYAVGNGINGTVSLLGDGYTARFTAAANTNGIASFTFTATDPVTATGFGPVSCGILITTNNAVVSNTPPALAAISNYTRIAGAALTFTNSASDSDVPAQTLTFALLDNPGGATLTTNSGIFNWRPTLAQGGSSNVMKVVVTDSGSPVLSATQSFSVVINVPAQPVLQPGLTNGLFSLLVVGDSGPDCIVQASTNLVGWTTVTNAVSPSMPFQWSDADAASFKQRFYRVLLGP
jgi:hypothetical protein